MKRSRLTALVLLLAALLCACAKTAPAESAKPVPEPTAAPESLARPEAAGATRETSEEEPTRSPAATRMADITAADIRYTDWDIDREMLASALREASACETAQKPESLTHYMLSVYLTDVYSSAAENFSLTAGLDEPLVSVLYTDPKGSGCKAVFENETLYWLLRDLYRVEPQIDEAALAKYQDILDASAQKRVTDSLALADASGFPGYTGFEIYCFVKTDSFTDGADAYDIYSWDAAFLTDDPDKVPYAGGMRLDAEARIINLIQNTVFAVKNPGSGSEACRFLHWGIYQGGTEQTRTQNARTEVLAAFQAPPQE